MREVEIVKNILCVCNTYFQLIVAFQMNLTLFKEDNMTIVLSDHSNNADKVILQISKMNFFSECYYIKTKDKVKERSKFQKLDSLKEYTFGNDKKWADMGINKQDEMVYFNYMEEVCSLFSYLKKKNSLLNVSRMEEGILSYNVRAKFGKVAIISKCIRHILGKKCIDDAYHNFYCFYPEFYKGGINPVKIPQINAHLGELLTEAFEIKISPDAYKEKYIYFSSVYDFEGGKSIGELDLIMRIADLVGRDNLLVKVHPRDNVKRFEKAGLKVDSNSSVPWEVIQLGRDFSNHVFMATNSGSVLSVSLIQEKAPKIYYMYKMCDSLENLSLQKSVNEIETLIQMDFVKNSNATITIVENIEEIVE